MSETVKSIMEGISKAFVPEAAAGVDAVFQFEVTGDQAAVYHLIVKNNMLTVKEGSFENPNVVMNMDTPDFIDLMTGQLDGMSAFMSGKLRIDGDIMLAQTFATFFTV
jgi:putative sterol carrier protein